MKSLQTKILTLILTSVLAACALTGFSGIYFSSKLLHESATDAMKLISRENAAKVDGILQTTETSVNTLARYIEASLESVERLSGDEAYRAEFSDRIESIGLNHAISIPGALSFFVRYDPALTAPTSGVYQARKANEPFARQEPTDLSDRDLPDPNYIDWWTLPSSLGEPVWLRPYRRDAIDVWTITYAVPLYKDNTFFGVVGIGISFGMIEEIAWNIHIYDTGFAFIVDKDSTVMYHPKYELGKSLRELNVEIEHFTDTDAHRVESDRLVSYRHDGEKKVMSYHMLKNGMFLLITAPQREIMSVRNALIRSILFSFFLVLFISAAFALLFSWKLIRQIKELDSAAKQMVTGNLNVTLRKTTNDEAGELAESIMKMQKSLSERIITLNAASYQDDLTHVKNKNAYQAREAELNKAIAEGTANFGIAVFDVNFLKETNDRLGHSAGDEVLKTVCSFICSIFKRSPVYRIGGDEFTVVLEGEDLVLRDQLIEKYNLGIPTLIMDENARIHASCACGVSVFDAHTDTSCADVFNRADRLMYQNKKVQKTALARYMKDE